MACAVLRFMRGADACHCNWVLCFFSLCISQPLFLCYPLCLTFQLRLPLPPTHFLFSPFPLQLRCTQHQLPPHKPQQCSVGSLPPNCSLSVGSGSGDTFILSSGWGQGPALGPDKGHLELLITLMTSSSAYDGCHPQCGLRVKGDSWPACCCDKVPACNRKCCQSAACIWVLEKECLFWLPPVAGGGARLCTSNRVGGLATT